jgi:hypothetical protein
MAASDYIQCKRCECKLIYDGDNEISDSLEKRYGDPKAWVYTPLLLCPDCIQSQENVLKEILTLTQADYCQSSRDYIRTLVEKTLTYNCIDELEG